MKHSLLIAVHRGLVSGYDFPFALCFQLRQLDLPVLCYRHASLPKCNSKLYPREERFPLYPGKRGRHLQGAAVFRAHGSRSSGGRSDGFRRSIPCAADGSLPGDKCSNPSPITHDHQYPTVGYTHAHPGPTLPYADSAAPSHSDPRGDTKSQPYPYPSPSSTDLSQPSGADHRTGVRSPLGGSGGDLGNSGYV